MQAKYTQQQKKRENFYISIHINIHVKCMLHVKLTVLYTVSFTCNIHFLNST